MALGNDQNAGGQWITGGPIQENGRWLLADINDQIPEQSRIEFEFTSRWLWRFQRRWGLKSRKKHEEEADADTGPYPKPFRACRRYVAHEKYCISGMWTNTGCNYAMPPNRSNSRAAHHGRKKNKTRITLLCYTNANGTKSFQLCIIGTARPPRCFRNKSAAEHGLECAHNKNAWVTMPLFLNG